MKRQRVVVLVLALMVIGLLGSCVSVQGRAITPEQRQEAQVVGHIEAKYTSYQPFCVVSKKSEERAYAKLKEAARKKYEGDIDVVNVTASGGFHPVTLIPLFNVYAWIFGNFQWVTASGDVIKYSSETGNADANQRKLQGAIETLAKNLITTLPAKSTIAVLNISSRDRQSSEFTVDELEYALVRANKFTVVDRARLDQIRSEQNFQVSGEVNDESAVSIGNMLGASIVIVGDISATGSTSRITIRALDVKTAQIVTMVREPF